MNTRGAQGGFSLVELVAVIVLLGILAAVTVTAVSGSAARDLIAAREAVAAELRRVRAVAMTSASAVQADFTDLDTAYRSTVALTPATLSFAPPHGAVTEAGGATVVAEFVDLELEVDDLRSTICVRRRTGRVLPGSCAP